MTNIIFTDMPGHLHSSTLSDCTPSCSLVCIKCQHIAISGNLLNFFFISLTCGVAIAHKRKLVFVQPWSGGVPCHREKYRSSTCLVVPYPSDTLGVIFEITSLVKHDVNTAK